ncbi:MAG: hypothetical protein QNJ48_05205 [Desulfobacterales bacterium]|nr:hypothetical protein [Desulfobacterales bacterium]MDJ0883533.1 hypothetical protein [Desulfobacterales bacterium]
MIVESPPDTRTESIRSWVEKRNSCFSDRRSGVERRVFYSLVYFASGGHEKRSGRERRSGIERRRSWAKDGLTCMSHSG